MYECMSCGCRFEEPTCHKEPREYWGYSVWEDILGCPRCGGAYAVYKEADDDKEAYRSITIDRDDDGYSWHGHVDGVTAGIGG